MTDPAVKERHLDRSEGNKNDQQKHQKANKPEKKSDTIMMCAAIL
jgi:hypothetical protein